MTAKTKHLYKAFGLNIESDFEFTELAQGSGQKDVEILNEEVPKVFFEDLTIYDFIKIKGNEIGFKIKGVGDFYIDHGKRIIIQPTKSVEPKYINQFTFSVSIGMLLIQRGCLPMHGSAVNVHGEGILICGQCGAGKSTLSYAFSKSGFPLLTDDIAVIEKTGNEFIVYPGYSSQKLCPDSFKKVYGKEGLPASHLKNIDKFVISNKSMFSNVPVALKAIFELSADDVDNVQLQLIRGVRKHSILMNHIYKSEFVQFQGLVGEYFRMCSDISSMIPVYSLIRPKETFTYDQQMERVFEALKTIA